jgi:hypothetical protein
MSQKVYTFTVSERDEENLKLVEQIKQDCRLTGRTFTFICLEALREYVAKGAQNVSKRK